MQDGKPYILTQEVGPALGNSISEGFPTDEGYNFIGKSTFKTLEDMWFYDKDCPVHNAMRARVPKEVDIRGILTVFYTPSFSGSL